MKKFIALIAATLMLLAALTSCSYESLMPASTNTSTSTHAAPVEAETAATPAEIETTVAPVPETLPVPETIDDSETTKTPETTAIAAYDTAQVTTTTTRTTPYSTTKTSNGTTLIFYDGCYGLIKGYKTQGRAVFTMLGNSFTFNIVLSQGIWTTNTTYYVMAKSGSGAIHTFYMYTTNYNYMLGTATISDVKWIVEQANDYNVTFAVYRVTNSGTTATLTNFTIPAFYN